jgi:glycosyltransferase involved in cell wall biosynthesis
VKILLTADPELPVPPGMYGGIERIVEVLVNAYTAAGHEVVLCAHPASQVPCRLIGWKGPRSQHPMDTLRNMLSLTRLVYQERFDIIHSFSRLAYMTAIFPLKVPKIMSYQREPSLQQVKKAVRLARRNSLVFTGCSDYISKQLTGIAESYTVYNCAPIERYTLTEKLEEDAPLMFLGRIEDIKGTHIAVEVARRTGRRLIIAGNIPADKASYFDERIKPFLDERIRYIGPVNDEQKNEWLGKASAFIMAVQWNEPFGIVMAEAMACGTPVLGLPFGSVPEVVRDGINGYLCRDIDDMVRRIADIPAIDRKKVRQIAEQDFSNTKIAADYLALYSRLISRMN